VRGRDHDAEIGAQSTGQHGDGRRRHRPGQHNIHADRDETGGQRRLEQIARQARILADDYAMAVLAAREMPAGRDRDLQHGLGGHRLDISRAAHPVGAEQLTQAELRS